MKKIVSLIALFVFVASCTNDDSDELLYNETQKLEKKTNSQQFAREGDSSDVLVDTTLTSSPPPPPLYGGGGSELCEGCPIDPPKGGTKP